MYHGETVDVWYNQTMKITGKVIGVIVFIAVLTGLTWLSTEVYITGLHISASGANTIHIATILFWILFVFSFFSGEMITGEHIKRLYRFCNIVFGMMFYLFLGSVVLSIILAIDPFAPSWVAVKVVVLSLGLGIIGMIQAHRITTTTYEVTLPDAPSSWNGKTAVFLSDTHFGIMNHEKFSDKIVNRILAINPDFVLHGGDFYDGPAIDMSPIIASWKKITDKIPVFYTSGNHEMYGPYEAFVQSVRDAGVTVLLNQKTLYSGIQIAGITYLAKGKDVDAQKAIESLALDPNLATILINHPPTFHDSVVDAGATLMVSGHTHNGQFSPLGLITRMIYKKYNYGLHKVSDMTAITSRGVGTAGPPMRLFNSPELVVIKFKTR